MSSGNTRAWFKSALFKLLLQGPQKVMKEGQKRVVEFTLDLRTSNFSLTGNWSVPSMTQFYGCNIFESV